MKKQQVGVFGLHEFGRNVAIEMARRGCQVIAVDKDNDCVEAVADYVTLPACVDVTDPDEMESLGIANLDFAIVAMGKSLEASILATIMLKSAGVPYVIAKVNSKLHEQVLLKVGADQVVNPERMMAVRLARSLVNGNFTDVIELSSQFSIAEVTVPESWAGKSLRELALRKNLGLNVIAAKDGENVTTTLNPDRALILGETLLIAGDNDALEKIK